MSAGSVIARGRVAHVDGNGDVTVSIDQGLPWGGHMIKAQPLPGDEPARTGSTVYVEVEVSPGSGRSPRWARIVDRPESMVESTVRVDRDVLARRELAKRVKEAIRELSLLGRASLAWCESLASAAADVIMDSDLRAPADETSTLEAVRAVYRKTAEMLERDDHEGSLLRRQLDDATAEVARLARRLAEAGEWAEGVARTEKELQDDLERRDGQVGRAMQLAHALWTQYEVEKDDFNWLGATTWPDVIRWVSDPPTVDEFHAGQQAQFDQTERTKKPEVTPPDPSQDESRTPIAAGWGRERSTLWVCPCCCQAHEVTGATWLDCSCGARYRFVYRDEPDSEVTAGEVDGWRWWRVEDAPDDDWLVYDNRPTVDKWPGWAMQAGLPGPAGQIGPCPKLVQGRVPWAVVREATGS